VQLERLEHQAKLAELQQQIHDLQGDLQRQHDFQGVGQDSANASGAGSQASSPGKKSEQNIEYLKNVVISYLSTSNTVEHRRLLPVLAGLLHLREEERTKVEATIAQSESGLHAVAGFANSAFGSLW
jgi:hypothetical protein